MTQFAGVVDHFARGSVGIQHDVAQGDVEQYEHDGDIQHVEEVKYLVGYEHVVEDGEQFSIEKHGQAGGLQVCLQLRKS